MTFNETTKERRTMNLPGYDAWKTSGPPEPKYNMEIVVVDESNGRSFTVEIFFDHNDELDDVVNDVVKDEWGIIPADMSWREL